MSAQSLHEAAVDACFTAHSWRQWWFTVSSFFSLYVLDVFGETPPKTGAWFTHPLTVSHVPSLELVAGSFQPAWTGAIGQGMLPMARLVSGSIWYLPRSGAQRIDKGKRLPWKLDCRAEKILRKVASGQLLLSPNMPGMQGPQEGDKTVERRKKHSPSPRPPLPSCPNKAKGCASPQIKVYWNWKAIVSSLHLYWASISPNRSLNLFSIPLLGEDQ